jgi:hypothetical protein
LRVKRSNRTFLSEIATAACRNKILTSKPDNHYGVQARPFSRFERDSQ